MLGLVARRDGCADLARPLPHARLVVRPVAEGGQAQLRERDRNRILPLTADHLAVGDVLAKILPDLPADDLSEPRVILLDLLDVRIGPVHATPSTTPSRRCSRRTTARRTSRCRSIRSPSPAGS